MGQQQRWNLFQGVTFDDDGTMRQQSPALFRLCRLIAAGYKVGEYDMDYYGGSVTMHHPRLPDISLDSSGWVTEQMMNGVRISPTDHKYFEEICRVIPPVGLIDKIKSPNAHAYMAAPWMLSVAISSIFDKFLEITPYKFINGMFSALIFVFMSFFIMIFTISIHSFLKTKNNRFIVIIAQCLVNVVMHMLLLVSVIIFLINIML